MGVIVQMEKNRVFVGSSDGGQGCVRKSGRVVQGHFIRIQTSNEVGQQEEISPTFDTL